MPSSTKIILASASARRQTLLKHIVDNFSVCPADIDETPSKDESPHALVERLAINKAKAVSVSHPKAIVIGSDTVVCIAGKILGKPRDYKDYEAMLSLLSDDTHQVYTGVCVMLGQRYEAQVISTEVTMAKINAEDLKNYWQSGEPQDKAGSYAIQGIGGQFVKSIKGSFSAVVGLPIYETKQMLINFTSP